MLRRPQVGASYALLTCLRWINHFSAVAALPQVTTPVTYTNPNITFYIYPTPAAADSPITDNIGALLPSQPITMVFHGFKGDRTARSMVSIREALLLSNVSNVVMVDWGPLADAPNQTTLGAYHHVRDLGVPAAANLAVQWLHQVMQVRAITPKQVHLIGFSLGAHLVGIVGHIFNSTLGRISGLDPPEFGYEHTALELRLDSSDAQFVNVIHTSASILSYTKPIGHVDFFPNGDAVPQPGCPQQSPIDIITCSHYFAFVVFAESVYNNNAFLATECSSWKSFTQGDCTNGTKVPMGYATPDTARGVFYMMTMNEPPFGDDDVHNPIPQKLANLLQYDKDESVVKAVDVVNFLMHKESTVNEGGYDLEDLDSNYLSDEHLKVMKMKTRRQTTTTPDPPAFQDSAASDIHSASVIFINLAVWGLLQLGVFVW